MKKYFLLLFPIFFLSLVSAEEECGITNLASCISEKFFEFFLDILNAPIQPLLNLVHDLLIEPVNINIFSGIWGIVVYILSMFYGLLLLYIGLKFVMFGYSVEQRENAKTGLANIIIMMVLVQASFYIYSLIIEVNSSVTAVVLNMIQEDFFLLTADNISNLGLELVFVMPYLISIVLTLIILTLRYMVVSFGVVLFAIGIFFYFIEPLNNYGKLILNFLFIVIISTFFYAIVFLASSKLVELNAFSHAKILVMIGAFALVDIATILLSLFVVVKSALKVSTPVMQVASVVRAVA